MGKLVNRIALVTGGGRGIGKGIAVRLAAEGAHVIINYSRSRADAEALADAVRAEGGSASTICADLSDLAAIATMFEAIKREHSHIDILVNNAARGSSGMPRLDTSTPEQFEAMMSLNMRGLYFTTQAAVRLMRDGGRVISISSSSTMARVPGLSIYAGTKAAVEAFTRIWAAELASRRITVNAVLPGITDTDLLRGSLTPEMARQIGESVPLGRMGTPKDMAGIVAFLASEDGGWITGQNLVAAGGAA
ncbi:3-oxoacyl-[acyl-carrier protein] reductase [Novosphingobium hassiacum]|uniref:3-oxoacyl-[acyl-carrier protein] reductase n=1 Tax=Novosphingobium hassiacum TaxID=173676 RepID=A0A7W5ZYL1_9SPHN|nr:SDR family oxidoreductase [Novosphingobium hassiacum]MBB3860939.1 3-oxoacyl-[acyl-carrier protein] reductase [Novosphingobium hassiacum]